MPILWISHVQTKTIFCVRFSNSITKSHRWTNWFLSFHSKCQNASKRFRSVDQISCASFSSEYKSWQILKLIGFWLSSINLFILQTETSNFRQSTRCIQIWWQPCLQKGLLHWKANGLLTSWLRWWMRNLGSGPSNLTSRHDKPSTWTNSNKF